MAKKSTKAETTTKTATAVADKAKEERLLARRARREAHEANVVALQKNKQLWSAFVALRDQVGVLDGDKKAAVATLRKLLSASARRRRATTEEQRQKKLERIAKLNERIAKLKDEVGVAE